MNEEEMEEKLAGLMDALTTLLVALTNLVESKTESPKLRGRGKKT